ncbi:MAG TPA: hypothetical protein VN441_10345, partial [Syntrophomonas sp.]|nr:hypothetical protein [Syntrophomonas sp.]
FVNISTIRLSDKPITGVIGEKRSQKSQRTGEMPLYKEAIKRAGLVLPYHYSLPLSCGLQQEYRLLLTMV